MKARRVIYQKNLYQNPSKKSAKKKNIVKNPKSNRLSLKVNGEAKRKKKSRL